MVVQVVWQGRSRRWSGRCRWRRCCGAVAAVLVLLEGRVPGGAVRQEHLLCGCSVVPDCPPGWHCRNRCVGRGG
eukprot:COSAG02_NODE_2458_length_8805_cov_33.067884_5_plen_74_part_00